MEVHKGHPELLVFVDETGTDRRDSMRRFGYSVRGKPAKAAIQQTGAVVQFLPLYSPDLNLIEEMFSKLKSVMKAHKETVDNLNR